MVQQPRTIEGVQTILPMPGNLDLTRRVGAEHAYSDEAMEGRAEAFYNLVDKYMSNGQSLRSLDRQERESLESEAVVVAVWQATHGRTPAEIAAFLAAEQPKPTLAEQLSSFLRTERGAQLMQLDWADRRRMIGTDFLGVDFRE
jgi:hypothetical protein